MSRKAKVLSLSKSFKEGISPEEVSIAIQTQDISLQHTPLMIRQKMQAAMVNLVSVV